MYMCTLNHFTLRAKDLYVAFVLFFAPCIEFSAAHFYKKICVFAISIVICYTGKKCV